MRADHYEVLGVPAAAGLGEIRAAYLEVMRANHPDLRPGDARAAARARDANAAWSVLREPRRRALYDRQRAATRVTPAAIAPDDAWATPAELRERARRDAAYSERSHRLRVDFHRASLRWGLAVLLVGTIALLLSAAVR